jgi:hypothetical protein
MSGMARPEGYWDADRIEAERAEARARRLRKDAEYQRQVRLTIQFYGGVCAYLGGGDDRPENPPSLATCKRSPTSGGSPGLEADAPYQDLTEPERDALPIVFRLGVEDVDRAVRLVRGGGDRLTALYAVMGRERERVGRVLALLELGEVAHALRLATCGQRSVQLECPEMGGGCGSEENYVPLSCGSRLCGDCTNDRMGQLIEEWKPAVQAMSHPTFATFTIKNADDPTDARDDIVEAFGRLRRRTIPFEGTTEREGVTKRWCWWDDDGRPADRWKVALQEAGAHDLVRRLQSEYVRHEWEDVTGYHQGRAIPFDELVRGGLYAVDVKQAGLEEFNVHLHVVMDAPYIPQPALSAVWEDLTGDPVVDLRRIYDRSGDGIESALAETVAYAVKSPEFETFEDAAEFTTSMKGKALVHPFGTLHGEKSDTGGLLRCANCDMTPAWWNYVGLVEERIDNMGKGWDVDADRPPPE